MKILRFKNTTEVFSPKKLLPNALASSCISSDKPHKRGIIFFSMTLLLFLFAANGALKADCPVDTSNPWISLTIFNNSYPMNLFFWGDCLFRFEVCYREEFDILTQTNKTVYYISKIWLDPTYNSEHCNVLDLNIMANYSQFIYLATSSLTHYLIMTAAFVPDEDCNAPPFYNLIRVGHPSCVTEPYKTCRVIQDMDGYWLHTMVQTIHRCFEIPGHCYSYYKVCRNRPLIKIADGTEHFNTECISAGPVTVRPDYCNYFSGPETITLECHPVCGPKPPIDATPTSVVETVIISSVSPNPTTNGTTLTLEVLTAGSLNIKLVNVEGQELMELHNAHTEAGEFTRNFTMSNLPQGVYYLRISHNGNVKMEKVIRN